MKFISLFAGIGGLDLGLERAGFECVAQVEINDYCQSILQKHWANVPKYKDVRDVGKSNLPTAELICGGFPCQDVSLAGQRAGLEGKRSTLWSEFHRIVCEVQPRWVIIENVSGLFTSDDGRFFTKILRELSESGYCVEWDAIPASAVGAPHGRDRVFIVAYSKSNGSGNENPSSIFEFGQQGTVSRVGFGGSPVRRRTHSLSEVEWNFSTWGDQGKRLGISPVCRVDDGLSNRVDRMKALGNAVVPQVAEFVGRQVIKAEARLTQREPDLKLRA